MANTASTLCGCVGENEGSIRRLSPTPMSVPSYIQTQDAEDFGTDSTNSVSSTLARIGSVMVIRGNGDKLSYDPYGQCHTVLLVVSSPAGTGQVNDAKINNSLLGCKLPYVERFDVDISGLKVGDNIQFSSFVERYHSTIKEVRVVCDSALPDWETVEAGYGRILRSCRLPSRLERLTLILETAVAYPIDVWSHFFASGLPYLTNLTHLRLQTTSFGRTNIVVSALALQSLVLEEATTNTGLISLICLTQLSKLIISSGREVILSQRNKKLKFIELNRVPRLVGDIRSVRVANIESCPAEVVAHILSVTTTRQQNPLRHLGLRFIHGPRLYINATYLDVLFMSNVTVANINVQPKHKIEALYLHDVRLLSTLSSISVKHLVLSGSHNMICSYISNGGIKTASLESLAIDTTCEGLPSVAILEFLRKAKDTLTLFACFCPQLEPPKMPHLKYLATTTADDACQLPGMPHHNQLDVFACPNLEWEAVRDDPDILAVSKTQTSCDEVSQFWYAYLGFETPLVHGGNGSWSFLLSQDVRRILQDDDAFVERTAANRVHESSIIHSQSQRL